MSKRLMLAALCVWLLPLTALALGEGPPLAVECGGPRVRWSATEPPINLTHIFCGEVKSDGRAVGFHARPGGRDPATARVLAVEDGPNCRGVYTARVAVRRPDGSWRAADDKFSSLFPDELSVEEVVQAILAAYRKSGAQNGQRQEGKWRGDSGLGFTVEGWVLPDGKRINTAYPIYR